jgi:hypothetical protein
MRFRAEHSVRTGGCRGRRFTSRLVRLQDGVSPGAGGRRVVDLVPIWEPGHTVNPLRRFETQSSHPGNALVG